MYGRHPLLPIDHRFKTTCPDIEAVSPASYAKKLKQRLQWAYEQAFRIMAKNAARSKELYDHNIRCTHLEPGDLVLLRQKAFKGKHKLKNRWENKIYKVQERVAHGPIYKIRNAEDENDKVRVYHRNMLYPLLTRQGSEVLQKETLEQIDPALNTESESESASDSEEYDSAEEEPVIKGPVTRSRARAMRERAGTEVPVIDIDAISAMTKVGLHSLKGGTRTLVDRLVLWVPRPWNKPYSLYRRN